MNDIDQIKIILEKIRTNADMINMVSKEEWLKIAKEKGFKGLSGYIVDCVENSTL